MVARGADVEPLLRQVDYVFSQVLAPSTAADPKRLNHLCDRLAADRGDRALHRGTRGTSP